MKSVAWTFAHYFNWFWCFSLWSNLISYFFNNCHNTIFQKTKAYSVVVWSLSRPCISLKRSGLVEVLSQRNTEVSLLQRAGIFANVWKILQISSLAEARTRPLFRLGDIIQLVIIPFRIPGISRTFATHKFSLLFVWLQVTIVVHHFLTKTSTL